MNRSMLQVLLLCVVVTSAPVYASEWRQGSDAEINYVIRLVFLGFAEILGNIQGGNWQWKCLNIRVLTGENNR